MPRNLFRKPGLLGVGLAFGLGVSLAWLGVPLLASKTQTHGATTAARSTDTDGPSDFDQPAEQDPGRRGDDAPPPRRGVRRRGQDGPPDGPPAPPPRTRQDRDQDGPPDGPPPPFPPPHPLMVALDKDRDGELSSKEILDAAKAIKTLDKDGDGILSHEELRPPHPPGPPPGRPRAGRGQRPDGPPPGGPGRPPRDD
jgi:hypothetical protein